MKLQNSSLTDWIQTIAVVVGLLVAYNEIVVHDRSLERQKKEATFELLMAERSSDYVSAISSFETTGVRSFFFPGIDY